jgi:hypothetical protein
MLPHLFSRLFALVFCVFFILRLLTCTRVFHRRIHTAFALFIRRLTTPNDKTARHFAGLLIISHPVALPFACLCRLIHHAGRVSVSFPFTSSHGSAYSHYRQDFFHLNRSSVRSNRSSVARGDESFNQVPRQCCHCWLSCSSLSTVLRFPFANVLLFDLCLSASSHFS